MLVAITVAMAVVLEQAVLLVRHQVLLEHR
jgi:hypothetical protein